MTKKIFEGLEAGDLKRLINPTFSIDEFKSKLGKDADVCVLAFTVAGGKDPATDLVSFAERGYDWVIDADTSSGEGEDGSFLVFIEVERSPDLPARVSEFIEDLTWLSEIEFEAWAFTYYQNKQRHDFTKENVEKVVPLTSESYNKAYGKEAIDSLKAAAGVEVTSKAPVNAHTESIRIAAGLK